MKKQIVKIYGSNECPYCNSLKKYLKILRVNFDYVDIDLKENEEEYHLLANKIGSYYIPVIVIDDEILSPEKEFNTIPEAIKLVVMKTKLKKGG